MGDNHFDGMEDNRFNNVRLILQKNGIDLKYARGKHLYYTLSRSPEELEEFLDLCMESGISPAAFSYVFSRTYDELKEIVEIVTENNIPYSNSLFLRTPDEIRDIIRLCRENNIDITYRDDLFKHSFVEIKKIVDFCNEKGIEFIDKRIFENSSFEAIERAYTFCEKNGFGFGSYLGEEGESGFWILSNGGKYLMSTDGKTLLKFSSQTENLTIPPFVEIIGEGAFRDNKTIQSITIPAHVKDVGNYAFQGCSELRTVIFDGELSEIKESLFEDCTNLSTFSWPRGIKTIGKRAFRNTSIGNHNNYKNRMEFGFPDSIEVIGDSAFEGCSNLDYFYGSSNLKKVGNNALSNCVNLKSISLPAGVSYFSPGLFSNNMGHVYYGNWYVPIVNSKLRIGYRNYAEAAENIYIACVEGLRKIEEANVPPFAVLPMFRFIGRDSEYNSFYFREMCEIIAKSPKKVVYPKIISKFNEVNYISNAEYIVNKIGVDRRELSDLIVAGNNYNLLSCSIKDALANYQYLVDQKLISERVLRKLYFDDATGNTPADMLKSYYEKHKELPELFNSLLIEHNDKNKLELRDRLVYVSTMHLLDDNFDYKQIEQAKSKLKCSLTEIVISKDKELFVDTEIYSVIEEKYPAMRGVMYSLKDKLMGIDESWFNSLLKEMKKGGKDTTFDKFYNSLTVVKNWDKYDEIERMTLLKNEIVGRLLYADIFLTCDYETDKGYDYYLENRGNKSLERLLEFASVSRDALFFNSHNVITNCPIRDKNGNYVYDKNGEIRTKKVDVFSQIGFIETMLKIDPYSFDALRMTPGESTDANQLENLFAIVAKENGYLFSKDEKKRFYDGFTNLSKSEAIGKFAYYDREKAGKKRSFNSEFDRLLFKDVFERYCQTTSKSIQKTFSEFMSNTIGAARIPREMEGRYLDYVRTSTHKFLYSKSSDDLYSLCSSLDLYLRSKSEYEIQSGNRDVEESARVVFDGSSDISDDARIIYSLHNLNRLAHDVVEIDLKSVLDHRMRLNIAQANLDYKEFSSIITAFNDLFHVGFLEEDVMRIVDPKRSRFDRLKSVYAKFNARVDNMSEDDKSRLKTDEAFFEEEASSVLERIYDELDYKDNDVHIDYATLKNIMSKLEIIRERTYNSDGTFKLSENDRTLISDSVKAKSYFFEAKKLFAHELMGRMAREFSDDFVAMLGASASEKVSFYAKNGYIAEVQSDETGDAVLVCLCDKFNEPFSIHLKDMPAEVQNKLNACARSKTISYAKLDRRGLTLRDEKFVEEIENVAPLAERGFVGYEQLVNAIRSNYDNYDLPASRLRTLNVLRQIRDKVGRTSGQVSESSSELQDMFGDTSSNSTSANTNTSGSKHQ